ncbi:MAG: hypothetical protein HFI33_08935 [Lachnospiraceae bacterium]|nr:hypothetical protein [Lachnospiraceae bacterium]
MEKNYRAELVGASKLTIVNRGRERGEELAHLIGERTSARAEYAPWEGAFEIPSGAAQRPSTVWGCW